MFWQLLKLAVRVCVKCPAGKTGKLTTLLYPWQSIFHPNTFNILRHWSTCKLNNCAKNIGPQYVLEFVEKCSLNKFIFSMRRGELSCCSLNVKSKIAFNFFSFFKLAIPFSFLLLQTNLETGPGCWVKKNMPFARTNVILVLKPWKRILQILPLQFHGQNVVKDCFWAVIESV